MYHYGLAPYKKCIIWWICFSYFYCTQGRKIKEKTGNKNATSHIIQAISMRVQRGNTTSIVGTLGPLRKLEDFFDVISPREEES